jgi:hypothetical protein
MGNEYYGSIFVAGRLGENIPSDLTWRNRVATVDVLVLGNFCRSGGALHTKNG